ncbi:MAG: outer membrane protein transport protein [Syntrophales bacterium]|nr:outer membrane protein transport protein [Syntrophales bacterium]
MMRKWVVHLACVVTVAFVASAARAGNVDTYGIGAKATALGGAFSAYADDPFATYYNPAGLTQIEKPMLSLGTHLIQPSMNVYGYQVTGGLVAPAAGPRDFQDHASTLVVPHLGFAMPLNKSPPLVAGVGLYVPYGLDIKWGGTPGDPGAYNAYHAWYMREVVTPSLAYKVSDSLSLGIGFSLGKSKAGVERLAFSPLITKLGNKQIEMDLQDDMNWSVNLGVLYKPVKSLSAGLTYRGRTSTNLKGTAKAVGLNNGETVTFLPTATSGIVQNTSVNAETKIDAPEQIQFGIRYLPFEKVSLEVDLVWTRWSIIDGYTVSYDKKFLDAPGLGPNNPGKTSESFARDWKDTTQVRIGAEWQVNKLLALRGSYFYDPSPIPDTTMDIQWADADKRTFAAGFGLDFGKISVDGVIQYTITDGKREISGESSNLNNSYIGGGGSPNVSLSADGHLWGGGLTINYKF